MKILNLTQHKATKEQRDAGVIDYTDARDEFLLMKEKAGENISSREKDIPETLDDLLTFDNPPSRGDINERVMLISWIPYELGYKSALIFAPQFMIAALESALKARGVKPLHMFDDNRFVEG